MSYPGSRKNCYKCGNLGHLAEACTSDERLCYNCRQPGHEASQCTEERTTDNKQCYYCKGVGHIQVDCPTLKLQGSNKGNSNCYHCGRVGHIARFCTAPGSGGGGSSFRGVVAGRSVSNASLTPVKCFRCGGLNHMLKDCLAPPGTTVSDQVMVATAPANASKTCYKCRESGHIARYCPQNSEVAV